MVSPSRRPERRTRGIYKTQSINGLVATAQGPVKTFTLRGINESPPISTMANCLRWSPMHAEILITVVCWLGQLRQAPAPSDSVSGSVEVRYAGPVANFKSGCSAPRPSEERRKRRGRTRRSSKVGHRAPSSHSTSNVFVCAPRSPNCNLSAARRWSTPATRPNYNGKSTC